jgi:hypothetical protein
LTTYILDVLRSIRHLIDCNLDLPSSLLYLIDHILDILDMPRFVPVLCLTNCILDVPGSVLDLTLQLAYSGWLGGLGLNHISQV